MSCHVRWIVAAVLLTMVEANAGRGQESRLSPLAAEPFRNDARLWDVCLVDAEYGWAVGDRGVIRHTRDGGQTWRPQSSGVETPLHAVAFANREVGIAVGGQTHAYGQTSGATVLLTRDGGRQWLPLRNPPLPILRRVGLFDTRNGWAAGDVSAMYPSGLFVTSDGGQSWRPLVGPATTSWLAADMLDPQTGALAGRKGATAAVRRGEASPREAGAFGLRGFQQLRLQLPTGGWLAAEGGLLLQTPDMGASWQTPATELPETAALFDFHALAVHGPNVWAAGSPGTRVFHSADGGQTWQVFATGLRTPIRALAFAGPRHGVAVGDLGVMLLTTDGGQSWQSRQSGGARAALMGVFAASGDVPLELLARLCGDEGYLGVVEVVGRDDIEVAHRSPTHPADRTHEAVVAVGACGANTAWRFPIRQLGLNLKAEQVAAVWDVANDGRGFDELRRHLARQIRMWRPEVLVTHDASPQGDAPHGHLINQLVLDAVERAADPTSFAAMATDAGLEPWQVRKVFAKLGPGQRGLPELTTAQIAVRLGSSLEGLCAIPRGILHEQFNPPPAAFGFSLLLSRLPQEPGGRDFFEGIILTPGGEARRELLQPAAGTLDSLKRLAQRRQHLEGILRQSRDDAQTSAHLLASASELTRGMEPTAAGDVFYHLAQKFARGGQWVMAAEMFELLVESHPEHPLCLPALTWLVQYYASSEALWRIQGAQRMSVQAADGQSAASGLGMQARSGSVLAINAPEVAEGPKRAAELGARMEQTRPALFAQPSVRFPLAAAERRRGYPKAAERYFQMASRGANRDAWWLNARSELWLNEADGLPPKPTLRCAAARTKPRLDGLLDDDVWRRAKPVPLKSQLGDDAAWPAEARAAYDDQFLYLAVRCHKAPGLDYLESEGPRPRNADLSDRDRVELYIDLDRDYATWYRFTMDHRGWVSESCWGDTSWNPTWFVAQSADDQTWTVEAAIPLDQLTGTYPRSQTVWAVGLQRIVPGVGFQSWTQPAAIEVLPEGFGWLMFD